MWVEITSLKAIATIQLNFIWVLVFHTDSVVLWEFVFILMLTSVPLVWDYCRRKKISKYMYVIVNDYCKLWPFIYNCSFNINNEPITHFHRTLFYYCCYNCSFPFNFSVSLATFYFPSFKGVWRTVGQKKTFLIHYVNKVLLNNVVVLNTYKKENSTVRLTVSGQ